MINKKMLNPRAIAMGVRLAERNVHIGFRLNPDNTLVEHKVVRILTSGGKCPYSEDSQFSADSKVCPCLLYRLYGRCEYGLYIPDSPPEQKPSDSVPETIGSTEEERTHNGGTTEEGGGEE